MEKILQLKDIQVTIEKSQVCKNINFSLHEKQILGILGESGAGKSMLVQSLFKLTKAKVSGEALFCGENLLIKKDLRKLLGRKIGFVFQEAVDSLNPIMKIGTQITEMLREHYPISYKEAKKRALGLLEEVGIPYPERRFYQYPNELSGGLCQRVCIAIAISCTPKLLILDEPTTSLDTQTKMQILELIKKINRKYQTTMLVITHDLSVISKITDKTVVMHRGEIVEKGDSQSLLKNPKHPFTKKILNAANPSFEDSKIKNLKTPLLEIQGLTKVFQKKKHSIKAIDKIDLKIYPGSTLALVGESGSGKTTLSKILLQLLTPSSGKIYFQQKLMESIPLFEYRKNVQIIFQNPFSSLDPLMSVSALLQEPQKIHNIPFTTDTLIKLLQDVGLSPLHLYRYPHQLSGGQRQRVNIARALSLKPKLLVLDEPTSALDSGIKIQIISLLKNLQEKYNLSYLFISHDLNIVKSIADSIAVMYLGKIVEIDSCKSIFQKPKHPYTKTLLSTVLSQAKKEEILELV